MKERGTLLISLALLGGLAAGSYWLAEQARRADSSTRKLAHEADYYVDHFKLTRMDEAGTGLYTLSSLRMTHYADDDSTTLDAPRLVSLKPDRQQINIRADRGRVTSDAVEVHLYDNVELKRAAARDDPELLMKSQYLLVLPEQDIARTDQPVEMIHGASRVSGTGMEFDNGRRTVHLNPANTAGVRVHALIVPAAQRNSAAPGSAPQIQAEPSAKVSR